MVTGTIERFLSLHSTVFGFSGYNFSIRSSRGVPYKPRKDGNRRCNIYGDRQWVGRAALLADANFGIKGITPHF